MKKIAVIGGGTGISPVLRGLRKYDVDISAIVSAFDNGGSSGVLTNEFGAHPWGDIRQALLSLSSEEDSVLHEIFTHRFPENSSLDGHSLGNLVLHALGSVKKEMTMDAIKKASKLLEVQGNVCPVSVEGSRLCAELENKEIIKDENNIDIPKHNGDLKIIRLFLDPVVPMSENAKEAMINADLIVFGPGDLYTSIIPNTLVEGFEEAMEKTNAKCMMVCNAVTKWGETNAYKASDFASVLLSYIKKPSLDYMLCNESSIPDLVIKRYQEEKKYVVPIDIGALKEKVDNVIINDFIKHKPWIRHDEDKVSEAIINILYGNKVVILDLDDTLFNTSKYLKGPQPLPIEEIKLSTEAREVLETIKDIHQVYLVTAGDEAVQRRKVKALGIEKYFSRMCFVKTPEDKGKCFQQIRARHSENKLDEFYVIGDRFDSEIVHGNKEGFRTIRIKQGSRKEEASKDATQNPTHEVISISGILKYIV